MTPPPARRRGTAGVLLAGVICALFGGAIFPSGTQAGDAAGWRSAIEPDARAVPWDALRRLALQAGLRAPAARPISRGEILALLDSAAARLEDPAEQQAAAVLRRAYAAAPALAGAHLQLLPGELGRVVPDEAGLSAPAGLHAVAEPELQVGCGRLWGAATWRWQGGAGGGGAEPPAALLYGGWRDATALPRWGDARRGGDPWRADWPRAVAGVQAGRWALAAGRAPARAGPGLEGVLLCGQSGASHPVLTARRTAPFAWRGVLRAIAPVELLLRVGRVSAQTISTRDGWSPRVWRASPWVTHWRSTWAPAPWLDAGASLAALSTPRSGTLWPDLLQINFPLLSATTAETERGPVTDRIFALHLEGRFRAAPWPLLPRAGRVYWEYGGEDFLPWRHLALVPQLSAPASVAGVELVGPRWDLAVEYSSLRHPTVLWYAHSEIGGGFAHDGWVLGHALGGSGAALGVLIRWRPPARTPAAGREIVASLSRAIWGRPAQTPAAAERWQVELRARPADGRSGWWCSVQYVDESVRPHAGEAAPAGGARWVAGGIGWRI